MMLPSFVVPESIEQARAIQQTLRDKVCLQDEFGSIETVAGIDVGYDVGKGLAHASVVVMPLATLKVQEEIRAYVPVDFPYVPGFLSFREIPAILEALSKLSRMPDLLMVDGQGIAHPRRLGIAAHLGVLLDVPAVGVAKSRLTGDYGVLGSDKGDKAALMDGDEQIGIVLRSRDNTNPLFISPGHRVSIETALQFTLRCLTKYRLPEPTRLADKLSKIKNAELSLIT